MLKQNLQITYHRQHLQRLWQIIITITTVTVCQTVRSLQKRPRKMDKMSIRTHTNIISNDGWKIHQK